MPHIVVLSHRVPYPPNKGDKLRTYHQIRALREARFDVSVCTLVDDDERHYLDALRDALGVRVHGFRPRSRRIAAVWALLGRRPVSVSAFFSRSLFESFVELLRDSRTDAVVCTSSSMAEYVFRARTGASSTTPVLVMDFMDLDSEKWQQYALRSTWPMRWIFRRESRLLRHYEREAYRLFDASLLVSAKEAELFAERIGLGDEKLHAIGNGVDLTPPPSSAERPVGRANLLFTGVMDYFPNEDAMVWFHERMWPQVLSHWPHAKLTIAGMNPTRKIESLGEKDENVVVTGFVEDMTGYFAEADVFIAPFRIARGVQNKLLQAFAAGVPVVSTPEGAEGIDCTDSADVVIAGDPEQFVLAIDRLMSDGELHARLRRDARYLVESRYSWKAQTRELVELLETAIGDRARLGPRADP